MLRPTLRHVGRDGHPLVVIDEFLGDVQPVIDVAAALAPFPRVARSYYPGLRRDIHPKDIAANAYLNRLLDQAAQFIAGAFDTMRFHLIGASFSMVTTRPADLVPLQRAPHFDSTDPNYVALIHYLNVSGPTATAFFRQRETGIERVDDSNLDRFVNVAKAAASALPDDERYIQGGNSAYEELDRIQAVADRLIFYQGGLLHSGIIPADMPMSDDPRKGRLTANVFIRLERGAT